MQISELLQPGRGGQSGCNNPSPYKSAGLMKRLGRPWKSPGRREASWATGSGCILHPLLLVCTVGLLRSFGEERWAIAEIHSREPAERVFIKMERGAREVVVS